MVHRPRINPYICFFIIAAIAIAGSCMIPLWEVRALSGKHLTVRFMLPVIDAITVLLPYWLLPRRTRWLTLIPVWLIALWFTGGIWYHRFWGDFPDITVLFFVDNLNSELFNSAPGLWKWRDLGIIIFPVITTLFYFIKRKEIESGSICRKLRIAAIAASVLCYIGGQLTYSIIMLRYYNSEKVAFDMRQATFMRLVNTNSIQSHSIRINGFLTHYIVTAVYAYEMATVDRSLDDEEIAKIENYISNSKFATSLPDSLQQVNADKNIVLIVVESLNASVINAIVNNKPVAPTLMAFNNSDSVLSALNVETQIRFGGSGDGQLLANTGIYPLPRFSTSILLGSKNTFPGLPRILGRKENIVIFADSNDSWNESETFKSLGFDSVMCNLDYVDELHRLGSDAAMFEIADSVVGSLNKPFFLELLTVSMHIPFNDPKVPQQMIPQWIAQPDGSVSSTEKYYRMVNYFDSALALFIDRLKERGLYDNTMIFIVSDHAQNTLTGEPNTYENMVFMAVNSGIGRKIERRVSQIDVFPTIIQLGGMSDSTVWKGAGVSMLGSSQTPEEKADAIEISELILRGDYFRKKFAGDK